MEELLALDWVWLAGGIGELLALESTELLGPRLDEVLPTIGELDVAVSSGEFCTLLESDSWVTTLDDGIPVSVAPGEALTDVSAPVPVTAERVSTCDDDPCVEAIARSEFDSLPLSEFPISKLAFDASELGPGLEKSLELRLSEPEVAPTRVVGKDEEVWRSLELLDFGRGASLLVTLSSRRAEYAGLFDGLVPLTSL